MSDLESAVIFWLQHIVELGCKYWIFFCAPSARTTFIYSVSYSAPFWIRKIEFWFGIRVPDHHVLFPLILESHIFTSDHLFFSTCSMDFRFRITKPDFDSASSGIFFWLGKNHMFDMQLTRTYFFFQIRFFWYFSWLGISYDLQKKNQSTILYRFVSICLVPPNLTGGAWGVVDGSCGLKLILQSCVMCQEWHWRARVGEVCQ